MAVAARGYEGGPGYPVADVLGYLEGRWRVEREVRDLDAGATGVFRGTGVFVREAPGGALTHSESGEFTWGGVTRPAYRGHRFEPGPDGTALVCFADGRPFHPLDLREGRWTADHPCSADLYRGEFEVLGPDRWRVVWTVAGPAKRLSLATWHDRI
ncbi:MULTISPECIES: DUF6314 family protein [Streptomycetaceae]|nr:MULTISPECIES: DUF6314 family protein [Streptomycetaceae]MYS62009.1 hypothetical protein [Streptomyces sp. SID5468]CCB77902.1 conserved protein of unknown function [Streptantibioticus cattleyicolor NRRL 8057 = DSM 46488]